MECVIVEHRKIIHYRGGLLNTTLSAGFIDI